MWSVPDLNHVSGTDPGYMVCPARFERATYALEEIVAAQKTSNFNGLSQKTSTVQQTVQSVLFNKLQNKYRGASQS